MKPRTVCFYNGNIEIKRRYNTPTRYTWNTAPHVHPPYSYIVTKLAFNPGYYVMSRNTMASCQIDLVDKEILFGAIPVIIYKVFVAYVVIVM